VQQHEKNGSTAVMKLPAAILHAATDLFNSPELTRARRRAQEAGSKTTG
jgi:hypothetical protein